MPNLEARASYVVGFWRPKDLPPDFLDKAHKLHAWLTENAETYALIIHDLDISAETGERETSHVHFVAKLHECRRLLTNVNAISVALGVDPISVTLAKCSSVSQSMRYLVHKDDPQKHQYPMSEVVHNWRDDDFQKVMAGKLKEDIDFDFLVQLVRRSRNITEVISVLGLGAYRYWRPVISDLWKDAHSDN